MESSFQLMIAYDMFYYVKFTALFIKTTCKALFSFSFADISCLVTDAIVKFFNLIYYRLKIKLRVLLNLLRTLNRLLIYFTWKK